MLKLLQILSNGEQPLAETLFIEKIIWPHKKQPGIVRVKPRFQELKAAATVAQVLVTETRTHLPVLFQGIPWVGNSTLRPPGANFKNMRYSRTYHLLFD